MLQAARRRHAGPERAEGWTALHQAVARYLGSKLRLAPGALTYADVAAPLAEAGDGRESLASLKRLFDRCEEGRYAGGEGAEAAFSELVRRAEAIVSDLERTLR